MFTQDSFAPVSSQATTSPKVWSYATSDDIQAVLGAGYFEAKRYQLESGDWILCNAPDGHHILRVTVSTDSVVTSDFSFEKQIIVREPSDFDNTRSDVEYFIDGVVDMGDTTVIVPAGGLYLKGHNFDISKLVSSADNYTMFESALGGSGNVLGLDYALEVTGANSQVYNLTSATGFDAFEFQRINYNNCTSLGEITNYRQGLEFGTGRFGGTPTMTLSGAWSGGYRITTSIVRGLGVGFTGSLFEAGAGFVMQSRFLTDINADVAANGSLFDFAAANFPNASTIQVRDATISRNGVLDADDGSLTPNITAAELPCSWSDNVGISNTYEGGRINVSSQAATVISAATTFYDLDGTWDALDLQHFDSPANGQLRHLGDTPRNYSVYCDLTVEGTANNAVQIKIVKWDDSASQFVDVVVQSRQINNIVGSRDVAFFNILQSVDLDRNDYVKLQVANLSGTGNLTAEIDSYLIVRER